MKIIKFLFFIITIMIIGCNNDTNKVYPPKYLCIYYGWPSYINNANGNSNSAAIEFNKFDTIVLGDGIEHSSHGDHLNTINIITLLNENNKNVYGYIDLGVSTQNLSIETMKHYVDEWQTMGVSGIFWDDAGYDYGVDRTRQNTMIDYCHNKDLRVFMNAWNVDDVAGGNTHMKAGDLYLAECWLVNNGTYQSLAEWKIKADKCLNYRKNIGIDIACVSTNDTISPSYNTTDKFYIAWFGTAMYGFDYFQATDHNYSASNSIVHKFPNISDDYGTSWTTQIIEESNSHYYRTTETWELHIYGDGSTWGYGAFVEN